MVACLPLVQQVRGSIPGGVVNFHLKIFNLGARPGLNSKPFRSMYVEEAYSIVDSDSSIGWGHWNKTYSLTFESVLFINDKNCHQLHFTSQLSK